MVISLIAGLAIPVIIVGIPIYMGRKVAESAKLQAVMLLAGCLEECLFSLQVHGRCKKNNISGSKHYLTVASGVMMSVFVSPVIAAVTVGKEPQQPG